MTESILIQRGIPAHLRHRAAEVYDDAFANKLGTFLGTRPQRVAILEESFASDYAFVALSEGDLVGIAGFHAAEGQLLDIGFGALRRHLGWMGAFWAAGMGSLFTRTPQREQLLMDGIAVDARMRGKGVGSLLLDAITQHAQAHGFHAVALDVINTNPDARRLYERKGFRVVKTSEYGWLTAGAGFTSSTSMIKPV